MKMIHRFVLSAAFFCSTTPALAQSPKTTKRWAITHAQVHVGDGTVRNDATVVIDGPRIAAIGGAELLTSLPAGAKTIDAKGQWLTPGLLAADTSIGLNEIAAEAGANDLPQNLAGGIVASFEPSAAIRLDSATVAVAAIAGFTGAIVGNEQGLLAGQMSFVSLIPGGNRETLVLGKIAQRGNLGFSGLASRVENLQRLDRIFDDARFYQRNQAAFDRGNSRELAAHPRDLAALFPVLAGQVPLVIEAHRASDLLAALALAKQYKLNVILVGATEGWIVASELAAAKIAVLVQPTQNLPASYSQLNARLDNAAILARAGVSVLLAEVESAHMVPTIKQEAGIAVANGMPHEAALSALTLNIAKAFKLERDFGSVAPGKYADLVLWSADPFEFSTQVIAVVVHGQELVLQSRQTLLRERYRDLGKYRP